MDLDGPLPPRSGGDALRPELDGLSQQPGGPRTPQRGGPSPPGQPRATSHNCDFGAIRASAAGNQNGPVAQRGRPLSAPQSYGFDRSYARRAFSYAALITSIRPPWSGAL